MFQLRRGLEPGAEQIRGAQFIKQATLHHSDAFFIRAQRNVTVSRRVGIEEPAEFMHRY